MMKKTNNQLSKKLFIILILFFSSISVFAADADKKWTIAAQKFSYARGQKNNAVSNATAEALPASIMEKLNRYLQRNVLPDEIFERERYKLRNERQSLYLQLSTEYKKRDSLVLQDYSESRLKSKIREEEKNILDIKNKINENLEKLKQKEIEMEGKLSQIDNGDYFDNKDDDTELEKFLNLFKNIFVKDESLITQEDIAFYQSDYARLFNPSEAAQEEGYLSYKMEKEVYSSNINTLITGVIYNYDDYMSVTVDVYMYPGAKKIGSVMEVGSVEEMEVISSSLANQIIPILTNAMPVQVDFNVASNNSNPQYSIYIDDILQNSDGNKLILDSGVHNIQFVSDGYKTAATSYYFEGNKKYHIDVNLKEKTEGFIQIGVINSVFGDIFVNGEKSVKVNDSKSQIKINGNSILGEFVAENGETAFFYIPEELHFDKSYVTIKPKPRDREKYIDTRRKWMYGSYSALMVSLIPFFYTYGNLANNAEKYNNRQISYSEVNKWQSAYNVSLGITIGCGLFWGYELVRYFIAVNSVLPEKAKAGSLDEYQFYDFTIENENNSISESEDIEQNSTEGEVEE